MLPDGSLVFVESYRSQLTVVGPDGKASQLAYTAGAPNSCVLGADGGSMSARTAAPSAPGAPPR